MRFVIILPFLKKVRNKLYTRVISGELSDMGIYFTIWARVLKQFMFLINEMVRIDAAA